MCDVFKVNRSSYYANFAKKTTKTAVRHEKLSQVVLEIYESHNKIYGAPKIHAALKKIDIKYSLKLVQRIM